jgi:hypothetical protein
MVTARPMPRWRAKAAGFLSAFEGHTKRLLAATGSDAASLQSGPLADGTSAVLAASDELATTALDARRWYLGHPCPNREIGREFALVVAAYSNIAKTVAKVEPGSAEDTEEAARAIEEPFTDAMRHSLVLTHLFWKADRHTPELARPHGRLR